MRSNTLIDSHLAPGAVGRARLNWFGALVCILGLAYALRLGGLLSESLWIDEAYSLALAQTNPLEIVRGTAADQHPPLYYLVLGSWLGLGQPLVHAQALFYLRYLSVLIGALGVAAGAWIGRELLGQKVGLGTGLFLACSPMHIWYSQEARMYILLALLVTLSAGMTWRLLRGKRGWAAYGLVTLLALYTHYFSVFVILAENIFVIAWVALAGRRGASKLSRRPFMWRWLSMQAGMALAFAPWLPVAVAQTRFHQMSWVARPGVLKVGGMLLLMVLGEAGLGPFGVVVCIGLGVAALWSAWMERQTRRWDVVIRGYGFALGWLLVPFAAIALLSLVVPLFQTKQMLMLLPPTMILVAASLVRLPRLPQIVLVAALGWLIVGSLGMMYRSATKDGWREASAHIQARYRIGDVLYFNPAAGSLALDAYLARPLPQEGYPPDYDVRSGGWEGEPLTAAVAEREMAALVTGYERVWLVEFLPEFWDREGYLREWLQENGRNVSAQSFGRIEVTLYELAREPSP